MNLFKKITNRYASASRLAKVKLALSTLALVSVLGLVLLFVWQGRNEKAFDSATWKNKQLIYSKEYPRKKMVGSLLKNNRLVGKSTTEIDNLLGSSTLTSYFKECDRVYWLGPEGGFGVDSVWLCINFGRRTDHVVGARLVTD